MKALTLWQPWASLVALGAKTIETRSWSTDHRGPLAIHASATTKGFDTLPGDCEGTVEGGWRYGYIGDFQAAYCFRSSDEGRSGEAYVHDLSPSGPSEPTSIPLGAIVATCTLVDVVPIEGMNEQGYLRFVCPHIDGALTRFEFGEGGFHPATREDDVTDQRPYGDFTPGRFAWLLSDILQLPEPLPARGRQKLWEWSR